MKINPNKTIKKHPKHQNTKRKNTILVFQILLFI